MTVPLDVGTLQRLRLEDRHHEVIHHRLTVVTAGAGFGKSTLLRTWAERSPSVVLAVTAADRSVHTLAKSLLDGLRLRTPSLARTISASEPLKESVGGAAFASLLAQALRRRLHRTITLILDDVDELSGSESAKLIEALVRQLPDTMPMVVAGRSEPPFRLARLRGRGEVVEITASDLAFTPEETALLVRRIVPGASSDVTELVHRASGGWPVAVRLAAEAVSAAPPKQRPRLLGKLGKPGGALFSYLAEEVLGAETAQDRDLLRTIGAIGLVTVELCEGLGIAHPRTRLAKLRRKGVYFDTRAGSMELTPLVAEHLRAQYPLSKRQRSELLLAAAEWHCSKREWKPALERALRAESLPTVARILAKHGPQMVTGGDVRLLLQAIEMLDDRGPELEQLRGEALQSLGEWDRALEVYESLAGDRASIDPGLAWRMGLLHHMRGELDSALAVYARGRRDGNAADVAMLLGWWASAVWVTADGARCRELAEESFRLAGKARDDRALANCHTVLAMLAALDGDRSGNEAHYLRALEYAERAGDLLQRIRIHSNRGSRHYEEGSYQESIEETSEALRLAELTGIVVFRALALLNRGQATFRLGSLDEAMADFEGAREQWQRLQSRQAAYALVALGDVYRVRGDRAQARAAYEQAIVLGEPVRDSQALVPALAGLSRVVSREDPDTATSLADRAIAIGPSLGLVGALVSRGWARLAAGDVTGAAAASDEARHLATLRRDRAGLAESLELQAEIHPSSTETRLDEARSVWQQIGDPLGVARVDLTRARLLGASVEDLRSITLRLRRLGVRELAEQADQLVDRALSEMRPKVRIETLGGFSVLVDGVPVHATAWQSKKARDIVKILVAKRGNTIHREELTEILWPGESPDRTANRLSVALTVVRSIFDPDKNYPPDHYLKPNRTSVALALGVLDIDVDAFLADAYTGVRAYRRGDAEAVDMLERAESNYRGDFLQEDPYEDWAVGTREEARAAYLSVARALADLASADGDLDAACRYHLRILELDPYDEAAHLGLIATMDANGRHGEAHRLYLQYSARMAELEIEAAPFPTDRQVSS
ncbi:HTH-type transcriptional regulator MalT [bacterium BMS3Abin02]|nr:HTH-type transcriptional regulator MalT [bacterium BMS3Abin02]GBE22578.1 HTH-type transcriptional regulator MalT [bacterium BMS3Bbin01]HDL50274.1 tetratricopeptide repeat protein [Actinomycetota bacterium]